MTTHSIGSSSMGMVVTSQASPTTPPASMSTNPGASCSGNLSSGVVAGVVVGCAVALSLLTFCVTYLWMRSRNNRRKSHRGARHGSLRSISGRSSRKDPETKEPIVSEEMSNIDASSLIQKYLPRTADDKTVSNKVFGLLDNIAIHVDNFYRNTESIVAMLRRSKNAETLITHCLTELIIASISPSGGSTQSLLPMQFAARPSTDLFNKDRETGESVFFGISYIVLQRLEKKSIY